MSKLKESAQAILDWYDRDGSVGGLVDPIDELRAAVADVGVDGAVMPRFKMLERVRVKFGVNRGYYGTITHIGGDDGTYYGVKLDCRDKEVGYGEYELEMLENSDCVLR